jgi:hypothetical protein
MLTKLTPEELDRDNLFSDEHIDLAMFPTDTVNFPVTPEQLT